MRVAVQSLTVDIATRRGRRPDPVRVLSDVDLTLEPGAVIALIGESGCGKSMIANALTGMLPPGSRATGRIVLGDRTLTADDPAWPLIRGRVVGLVPQSAATSFTPVRTLGDQLDEIIDELSGPSSATQLCARAALPTSALSLYPHEISGGMAQRAALAAALAGDPPLIVADEPTSALDPDLAAHVWDLFAGLAAAGTTVLMITHDLDALLAADACASIAVMREGRILTQDRPDAVTSSADPYVAAFFRPITAGVTR